MSSSIWRTIRGWLGIEAPVSGNTRRTSRRERDRQQTRMLVSALGIVAVLAVIALIGGFAYDDIIKPNTVLAQVGDTDITREEYWKYQTVQLYQQANQYQELAAQAEGSQRTQLLSYAASFRAQAAAIRGTTTTNDATLSQMVEDQLYLRIARDLGFEPDNQAVRNYTLQQFAPAGAQLVTPWPEPTLVPQRAEWATATAAANATPVPGNATPGATPVSAGMATPGSRATPDRAEAREQATTAFALFQSDVFDEAHISLEDYYRLVARPQLAQELVTNAIGSEVPQTAPQVKASHILVGTADLARELYERATGGADFDQLARNYSTDKATAPTGGELGWFTYAQMTEPFSETAFNLEPGEISEPVQTSYGWHIIRVEDTAEDRALTDPQYQQAQQRAVQQRIAQAWQEADIDSDAEVVPTPTPTPAGFTPPANAPTPVPATPVPATPGATPVGTPEAAPVIEGPERSTTPTPAR